MFVPRCVVSTPLLCTSVRVFANVGRWLPLPSCADILQQPAPLASSALLVCRFVPRCVVFTPLLNKRVHVVAKVGKWLPLPSCADIFQQLAPVACCTFLVCIHALSALNYLSASLPSPPGPKSGQRSSTFADNYTNGCAGGEGSRLDHWGGGNPSQTAPYMLYRVEKHVVGSTPGLARRSCETTNRLMSRALRGAYPRGATGMEIPLVLLRLLLNLGGMHCLFSCACWFFW